MTTFAFQAEYVATAHPDYACHMVGFADRHVGTDLYLVLQRPYEHDQRDVALGMDTYHFEWCDRSGSGFGGIDRFVLHPDAAEVTFAADTGELLDGLRHLRIAFDLSVVEHADLRDALAHLFDGSDCFHVEGAAS